MSTIRVGYDYEDATISGHNTACTTGALTSLVQVGRMSLRATMSEKSQCLYFSQCEAKIEAVQHTDTNVVYDYLRRRTVLLIINRF